MKKRLLVLSLAFLIPFIGFAQSYLTSSISIDQHTSTTTLARDGWLSYANDPLGSVVGAGGTPFGIYLRFTPEELASYVGQSITKMKYTPYNHPTAPTVFAVNPQLQVYVGGSVSGDYYDPGTLVIDYTVPSYNFNSEQTIDLPTSVLITGTQEIWFGILYTTSGASYPGCSTDGNGTASYIEGKSNIFYIGGAYDEWGPSSEMFSPPANKHCWTHAAYVEFVDPGEVCDPATNLTAVRVENGNQLTWVLPTGKNREVILDEDFEGLPDGNNSNGPDGWTTIDADGDGNNWMFFKNTGTPDIIPGHSGTGHVTSASWNQMPFYPNNYLITPMVEGATSVSYWVCAQDAGYAAEHYALCVSSTGINASDFTIIFEETLTAKDGGNGGRIGERGDPSRAQGAWYNRVKDVPAGTKYIAWRHYNCSDWFRINIDDVTVYSGTASEEYTVNVYRNNVKIASNVEGTSYLDNFDPTSAVCYTVEVNCPSGEVSVKSNEACLEAAPCDAVTELEVEFAEDCTTAELSWIVAVPDLLFNIYRDGALIKGGHNATNYTDTEFEEGEHTWMVKVVCGAGESDPASVQDECLSVREIGLATFTIAPNPATSTITIKAGVNFNRVEVINFLGQTVLSQFVGESSVKLDVSALTDGVYFVRIASENGTSVKKFVKQ